MVRFYRGNSSTVSENIINNSIEDDKFDLKLTRNFIEQIAKIFELSHEKIQKLDSEKLKQKCFKKIIQALDEENWKVLNKIGESINQITDVNGRTVFQVLNDPNENLPDYINNPPETIIFQGGGPKGIAYIGAIIVLSDREMLKEVIRFAGTSAGAITAALLSVNFSHEEVLTIFSEKSLTSFLDRSLPKGGLCNGDDLTAWLDKLIEEKTKIKFCTFGELKKLRISDRDNFKHLHVFATKTGTAKEIMQFNSEDKKWDNLIISEAVRASISLPVIFSPHVLHFKDPLTGKRVPKPEDGTFMDGGLSGRLFNLPLEAFDQKKYLRDQPLSKQEGKCGLTNKRTLAFALYSPGEEIPKKDVPVESMVGAYQEWGDSKKKGIELFRQFNSYNQHRIIKISNTCVHTVFGFAESEAKLLELVESGKAATEAFFLKLEERHKRLESFKSGKAVVYHPPKTNHFYTIYQGGLRESFLLGIEIMGEKVSFHTDYRLSFSPITSQFKPQFSFLELAKQDARFLIISKLEAKQLNEAESIYLQNTRFFTNCFQWIIFRKLLIETNSFDVVEFFVEKFPEWNDENRKNFDPFIHACKTESYNSLSVLLKIENLYLVSTEPNSNKTVLYYLAKAGKTELVKTFCEEHKRRRPNLYQEMLKTKVTSDSGLKKTAYSIALEKGHVEIAKFILAELEEIQSTEQDYLSEDQALKILNYGPLAQDALRRATASEAAAGIVGGIFSATIVGLSLGLYLFEEVQNNIRNNNASKLEILYRDDYRFKLFVLLGDGKIQEAEVEYQKHFGFLNALMATHAFKRELRECLNNCDIFSNDPLNNRYNRYVLFFLEKGIITQDFVNQLTPRFIKIDSNENEPFEPENHNSTWSE